MMELHNTIQLFLSYLFMRIKGACRLVKEMGIVHGTILCVIVLSLIFVAYKLDNHWVIPISFFLILETYHIQRRDKAFIRSTIKNYRLFILLEYISISLPFVFIELLQQNYCGILFMLLASVILPFQMVKKIELNPVRLPFLYPGSIEYIRMFRYIWVFYLLLFTISFIGGYNGNIKIAKVAIIIWAFASSLSHMIQTDNQILRLFRDYKRLILFVFKSNLWNSIATTLPLCIVVLCFDSTSDTYLFSFTAILSIILFTIITDLLHYLARINIGTYILFLGIFFPICLFSIFMPLINLCQIFTIGMLLFLLSDKTKELWK